MQIKLNPAAAKQLRIVDDRLMSYNVEMTEVTGGTFWKAYTPEQIAGTEEFPPIKGMHEMANLMQWYDPIDTTNPRLLKLAKEFGPVWVRVSGTWATKTYYDFDGEYAPGQVPEGYLNVLTKEQWDAIIEGETVTWGEFHEDKAAEETAESGGSGSGARTCRRARTTRAGPRRGAAPRCRR